MVSCKAALVRFAIFLLVFLSLSFTSISAGLNTESVSVLPKLFAAPEHNSNGENADGTGFSGSRIARVGESKIGDYETENYNGGNDSNNDDIVVGHVAADFAVNANGAATYNIPIAIPPGIAEVQPSIALNYNSQSGDGIAGRGFNISGLSQITRCGSTLAQDDAIRPVQLDEKDHYCLDGQRLVEVSRVGNIRTYQTEIKSYSEITAVFNSPAIPEFEQPISFTIKTTAGEVILYGDSANSRLNPMLPGSITQTMTKTLSWSISRTADVKGNYIDYYYWQNVNEPGTEHLIDHIEYTGTSVSAPFAAIHFDYEKRSGIKATSYVAGGALYQSRRLQKIRVTQGAAGSVEDTLVRSYNLGYFPVDDAGAHNYDRLKSVKECANYNEAGAENIKCLPPTWFRWDGGYKSELAGLFGNYSGSLSAQRTILPDDDDLKGDNLGYPGFDGQESEGDPTFLPQYGHLGHASNPESWDYGTYKNNDNPRFPGKDYTLMGDVNGDGLTDIIGLKSTDEVQRDTNSLFKYNYQVVASLSDGKSFQTSTPFNSGTSLLTNVWLQKSDKDTGNLATLADVNADGRSDLILIGYYYVYIALSNGSGFDTPIRWRSQDLSSSDNDFFTGVGGWARGDVDGDQYEDGTEQRYVMDINGDGRSDLVGLDDTGGIFAALSSEEQSKVFGKVEQISPDFYAKNSSNYQFEVDENSNFPVWNSDVASKISRFSFADVNGDRLPDAIRISGNDIEVAINSGTSIGSASFFAPVTRWDQMGSTWGDTPISLFISADTINHHLGYWLSRFYPHAFADINGDGLSDFVLFTQSGVKAAFSTGKSFQPPVQVSDNFGRFTDQYTVAANDLNDCHRSLPGGVVGNAIQQLIQDSYYHKPGNIIDRDMWVDERRDPRYLLDVNNDGRADIVGFGSNGIYVALSEGNSFGPMVKWIDEEDTSFSYDACWQPGYNTRTVGDVTGDGMADIIGIGYTGTHIGQSNVKPWRIEQIISGGYVPENSSDTYDGLHRSIDIEYDVLTTSASYEQGEPEKFRQFPLYVVVAHHDSDGDIGPARPQRSTLKYKYHRLRVDPKRGMQGFQSREVVDENAGTRTVEYYHQHFPLTGRVRYQETFALDSEDGEARIQRAEQWYRGNNANGQVVDPESEFAENEDISGKFSSSMNGVYEIIADSSRESRYRLNTKKLYQTSYTKYENYDVCGQPWKITSHLDSWADENIRDTEHEASYVTTTNNVYRTSGDCSNRNRLEGTTVEHYVNADNGEYISSATKQSSFEYYGDGLLWKEIVEPLATGNDNAHLRLVTEYGYDSVGNITSKTVSGAGGVINHVTGQRSPTISRQTTTQYSSDFRFAEHTIDPAGLKTTFAYDKRFGLVKTVTGPNGLVTETRYNGFGQVYLKEAPQGGVIHTAYEWCDADVHGATARYCVTTKNLNVATEQYSKTWYDSVDRVLRVETKGLKGEGSGAPNHQVIYQDKVYDHDTGRLQKESRPYFDSDTIYWTEYTEYDALGRSTKVKFPDGSENQMAYDGLTVLTTNAKGQAKTETRSPRGKPVKTIDDLGGSVTQVHNALGHLVKTVVSAKDEDDATKNVVTHFAFDLRGNKIQMTDPDMGVWKYYYNALGELTLQRHAEEGGSAIIEYDELGRMFRRTADDQVTTWTFYPANASEKNRGRLAYESSTFTDADGGTHSYTKALVYTAYGQPEIIREIIPGINGGASVTHEFKREYDVYGRLKSLTYPQLNSQLAKVGLSYEYDTALGYLKAVKNLAGSKTHWKLQASTAAGQVEHQVLGSVVHDTSEYVESRGFLKTKFAYNDSNAQLQHSGYTFDALGNLNRREDKLQSGVYEEFAYDDLNRLTNQTQVYRDPNGALQTVVTANSYDGHGNLLSRGDTGLEYSYHDNGHWHGTVHQVTQTDRSGAIDDVLSYDARGNMTFAGHARHIQWTTFNKPSKITKLEQSASFAYNSNQQRMLQTATKGWTWYAGGGLFERFRDREEGRDTFKYKIVVNGQQVGYVKQTYLADDDGAATSEQTYYLLTDHLGSITGVVSSQGELLQRLGFDAWGERRAGSWSPVDVPTPALTLLQNYALTSGFTGHEHDDTFGLINMKGRLYDPRLGRFISADPFVQAPDNTQSYNRYSYVFNNPLSYTDPSGYTAKGLLGFLRTAVAIASIFIAPHLTMIGTMAFSAATSIGLTLAAGGSLESALASGFLNGITAGLSRGVASAIGSSSIPEGPFGIVRGIAHGVSQGAVSVLQGGKFKHGFASAFASHVGRGVGTALGFGDLGTKQGKKARTVIAAVIGGAVSERTGGKFANGAITAAFVHLYNAEKGVGTEETSSSESNDDSGMLSGSRGFFKDLFRYRLHQDSLSGQYGDFMREDALRAEKAINAALNAYESDLHVSIAGQEYSFRSQVHDAAYGYVTRNKTFLLGRQATQMVMTGIVGRYTGPVVGAFAGGNLFYSAAHGAALNAYDNGVRGYNLISSGLIGSRF